MNDNHYNHSPQQAVICQTELVALLLTVLKDTPYIVTINKGNAFPCGPLTLEHHSLQKGMRNWVYKLTGIKLGHTEQLYTFIDVKPPHNPKVRISYMALLNHPRISKVEKISLYEYFPWEDRRNCKNDQILREILPALKKWAENNKKKQKRLIDAFGNHEIPWKDEFVLQRYEILWEVGLVPESPNPQSKTIRGRPLSNNNRRILATAFSRLRSKIHYTPVIFDLLTREFTLLELQHTMEAVTGRPMRKQNFRRLIHQQNLVIKTQKYSDATLGRPAQLFRFSAKTNNLCYLSNADYPLAPIF